MNDFIEYSIGGVRLIAQEDISDELDAHYEEVEGYLEDGNIVVDPITIDEFTRNRW